MKKDRLISIGMTVLLLLLIFVITRDIFLNFAGKFPLLGGFIKFFILASFGDFIAYRIKNKVWKIPTGMIYKAIVWGLIGVLIVLIFGIYTTGVVYLQSTGVLPFENSKIASAIYFSVLMNFTFAPTMMVAHKISDSYIDSRKNKLNFYDVVKSIDFHQYIKFTVFQTIPFFWVPAHVITFLLPTEYKIIFAAVLGIFLGLLLGLFNPDKGDK